MSFPLPKKPDKKYLPYRNTAQYLYCVRISLKGNKAVERHGLKSTAKEGWRGALEAGREEGERMVNATECTYASKVNCKTARGN